MKEIWKDIENFEGLYQVSNLGRVKSVEHFVDRVYTKKNGSIVHDKLLIKETIITPQLKKRKNKVDTYYGVALRKDKKYYNLLVHRLVAKAFIPNLHNYAIINHIDCDPHNNKVDNLEWCTYKHNNEHANRISRSVNTFMKNPNNRKPMTLMDKDHNVLKHYSGINEILQDNPTFKRNSIYNVITKDKIYLKQYRIKYT